MYFQEQETKKGCGGQHLSGVQGIHPEISQFGHIYGLGSKKYHGLIGAVWLLC